MANQPTTYSVALATLITLHCDEHSPLYDIHESPVHDSSEKAVEAFIQRCFLENEQTDSNFWYQKNSKPINALLKQFVSCGVNRAVSDKYHSWLVIASSSVDSFEDLISTLHRSIVEGAIDSSSSNGTFIRGVCLGFSKLSFESSVRLYKDFCTELDFSAINKTLGCCASSEQLEYSLRKKCLGQRHALSNPSRILQKVEELLDHSPELPSAYFMRFIIFLESGERAGAVNALHQYVDCVLTNNDYQPSIDTNPKEYLVQINEDVLQYAAILKAALLSSFGDHTSSMSATEEAVRVAQQSQDAECVAFSLGWLSVHSNETFFGSQLIRHCIKRSSERNLRSLTAGANLLLASRYGLRQQYTRIDTVYYDDRTTDATLAWRPWSNAASIDPAMNAVIHSCQWDRPLHMMHMTSGGHAFSVLARQRVVSAGIWDSYGHSTQSILSSLLTLHIHGNQIPFGDLTVVIQNIARSSLIGSTSITSKQMCQNGSQLHKILDLAENSYEAQHFSTIDCIYKNAIHHIVCFSETYHLPANSFQFEIALVAHEWSVRRGNLLHAEGLCSALESNLNPRMHSYAQSSTELCIQKVLLRARQGRYDDAKHLITCHLTRLKATGANQSIAREAVLLLHLSMVSLDSSKSDHFSGSLWPLRRLLVLAKDHKLDSLHATALSILAQVYLRMGNHKRGAYLIRSVLPSLSMQAHVWFQAEAYLTLGKCAVMKAMHMLDYKESNPKKEVRVQLAMTIRYLKQSEVLFRRCHDCLRLKEVYYLLARIYNALPNCTRERSEASLNCTLFSHYLVQAANSEGFELMSLLPNAVDHLELTLRPSPF